MLLVLRTDKDHMHLFVSAPPRCEPGLESESAQRGLVAFLMRRVPKRKKRCGKEHFGTSSYSVGTADNVWVEMIKREREVCQGKEELA